MTLPDASTTESRRVRIVLFGVLRCFKCHKIWGAGGTRVRGYGDGFLAVSCTIALSFSPKTKPKCATNPHARKIPFLGLRFINRVVCAREVAGGRYAKSAESEAHDCPRITSCRLLRGHRRSLRPTTLSRKPARSAPDVSSEERLVPTPQLGEQS